MLLELLSARTPWRSYGIEGESLCGIGHERDPDNEWHRIDNVPQLLDLLLCSFTPTVVGLLPRHDELSMRQVPSVDLSLGRKWFPVAFTVSKTQALGTGCAGGKVEARAEKSKQALVSVRVGPRPTDADFRSGQYRQKMAESKGYFECRQPYLNNV